MLEAGLILCKHAYGLATGVGQPLRLSLTEAYIVFVACWGLGWTLLGGLAIYLLENSEGGTPTSYVDSMFTIGSAASSTGLTVLDTSLLKLGSQVVLVITCFFCANTLAVAALPALFKYWRFRSAQALYRANSALLDAKLDALALAQPQQPCSKERLEDLLKEAGEAELHAMYRLKRQLEAQRAALADFEASPEPLGLLWMLGLVLAYYLLWLLVSFTGFSLHLNYNAAARRVLEGASPPINPTWFAAFHSTFLFTNTGFALLTDNLVQFSRDRFFVVLNSVVATMGFALHPLGIRLFTIAVARAARLYLPDSSPHHAALASILEHPRKYYSHLFSPRGTLACVLATLAVTSLVMAFSLFRGYNSLYFGAWSGSERFMNFWSNAVMVYNGGFNTFDISMLSQGTLLFMCATMWYTGRPFALGQTATAHDAGAVETAEDERAGLAATGLDFLATLRELFQSSFTWARQDFVVMCGCALIIAEVETGLLLGAAYTGPASDRGAYVGLFPIVFDLMSGYGNVGLSLGYPGTATSTCAVFSAPSKLVVLFMCLQGYCMGIFPPSCLYYELPPDLEGCGMLLDLSQAGKAGKAGASAPLTSREALVASQAIVMQASSLEALKALSLTSNFFHTLKASYMESLDVRLGGSGGGAGVHKADGVREADLEADFRKLPPGCKFLAAAKCAQALLKRWEEVTGRSAHGSESTIGKAIRLEIKEPADLGRETPGGGTMGGGRTVFSRAAQRNLAGVFGRSGATS
jgi:Trk-type K+ transport system membrane component